MLLKITLKDGDVVTLPNVVSVVQMKHPMCGEYYSIEHYIEMYLRETEYPCEDVQEIVIGC